MAAKRIAKFFLMVESGRHFKSEIIVHTPQICIRATAAVCYSFTFVEITLLVAFYFDVLFLQDAYV